MPNTPKSNQPPKTTNTEKETIVPGTRVIVKSTIGLPEEAKFRLSTYKALKSGSVKLQDCNYPKDYKTIKLLTSAEKGSSSESFISLGKLNIPKELQSEVVLKIAFKPKSLQSNALEAERRIYMDVTNALVLNGITPHVILAYADLVCNNFQNTVSKIAELNKAMQQNPSLSNIYDTNVLHILVTERGQGEALSDMLEEMDFETMKPVLFQILYTLIAFEEIGLRHNDLHAGNVLIIEYPQPLTNYYKVGDKCFKIVSKYQARIYDWDRGAKIATNLDPNNIENTLLLTRSDPKTGESVKGNCVKYGECARPSAKLDMFTLFQHIFFTSEDNDLQSFIEEIIPSNILQEKVKSGKGSLTWDGHLCYCDNAKCSTCTVKNEKKIKSIKKIIMSKHFKPYMTTSNNCPEHWTLPSERSVK